MTKKLHFLNGENIQNKNGIDKRVRLERAKENIAFEQAETQRMEA